jgi:putative transcriptional regulator
MKPATKTKRSRQATAGERLIKSLDQAISWAGGEKVPVRVSTVRVPTVNVRTVRRRLGLSQAEFAQKFGFPAATLRNWEQGRTRPDRPARVLLAVLARNPEVVENALRGAR